MLLLLLGVGEPEVAEGSVSASPGSMLGDDCGVLLLLLLLGLGEAEVAEGSLRASPGSEFLTAAPLGGV